MVGGRTDGKKGRKVSRIGDSVEGSRRGIRLREGMGRKRRLEGD